MAVSESGMWMHFASRYPVPSVDEDTVSFDMSLHEYQHRRLLMAISESGIWMHTLSNHGLPQVNADKVSFDMPLREYLAVLYVGLPLSLAALALEILIHRCHGKKHVPGK
ncbi:uncharacterized protein LOC142559474 isoform X1 [Dermacentor variabilis]|uniref:uncharacterized protein LOC142559474 isoform X1 n=1 Tax=Dermacentor variabilis TaxID=34621 RepID=UPI003F5B8BB1